MLQQGGDGGGLDIDAAADFLQPLGGALHQRVHRRTRLAGGFGDPTAGGRTRRLDVGDPRQQPLRRFADHDVGLAGAFGQRRHLRFKLRRLGAGFGPRAAQRLGHGQGRRFGARQVLEQNANVEPGHVRRPVERVAMRGQSLRALLEVSGDGAEPRRRFVAESHQLAGDIVQFGVILVDPLRQHAQQRTERPRLVAHGGDRAGEGLGFLAPGAAKNQPNKAKQRQRTRGDRHPLGERRRSQRLVGEMPPRGPGSVGDPQGRQQCQRPAEHRPAAGAARLRLHVDLRRQPIAVAEARFDPRCVERHLLDRLRQGLGAVRGGCHNRQFTSFIKA